MEATKQTKMTKEDLHLSWKDKLNIIRDNRYFLMLFPIVMLAVMILIFGVATAGRFFKLSVMKGILSQAIIIGTCATGVAFIYSNGNLDISIGAVLGLAATLGVKAYSVTQSVVVMILATVAVALGLMAFNCTMSVVCNIKTITVAIVVTQIYGAISTLLIGGSGKIDLDMSVAAMLEDGGFRYVAFFGYFIFCVVIYHFTRVGRELRFLGGNENCAAQTGISNSRATYISFLMTGVGVGLAAVFSVINVSAVSVETGSGLGMDVMLATVLGGMSIFGGSRSNAYAGLLGALTVAALNKGLLMVGVSSAFIQGICSMHWNSAGASRWRCRNPRWGHSNFMTMCITRMEPCWARKKGTLSSMTPAFLWTIMVGYILSAVSALFQASTPSLLPCIWLPRAASSLNWQTICVPCAKPHRSFCPSRRMLRGPNLRSTRFLKHRPCAKRMAVII